MNADIGHTDVLDQLNPEEYAQWQDVASKIRRTREQLRDERGRRYDLRPEGE